MQVQFLKLPERSNPFFYYNARTRIRAYII
ncbi:hypothetical protein [Proteus phage RP7]|nr:hypothetical protein [Proteus phage RP7]